MKLNKNLIISKSLEKNKKKIFFKIKMRKIKLRLYCIAFPTNKQNLLDIYNYNELLEPYYKKKDIHIIGLAKTKKEAINIVLDIIKEVYEETNGFDIEKYFLEKNKNG